MSNNLRWERYHRRPGVWLRLTPEHLWDQPNRLTEDEMDEIAKWCYETDCGRRMSYDQWQFKNQAEVTAFLLRWA